MNISMKSVSFTDEPFFVVKIKSSSLGTTLLKCQVIRISESSDIGLKECFCILIITAYVIILFTVIQQRNNCIVWLKLVVFDFKYFSMFNDFLLHVSFFIIINLFTKVIMKVESRKCSTLGNMMAGITCDKYQKTSFLYYILK